VTVEQSAVGRALCRLVVAPGPLETPCWLWPLAARRGYGQMRAGAHVVQVHRLVYRVLVGEPPAGAHLHHLCEVPLCANPEHLVPLAVSDHVRVSPGPFGDRARKTHCDSGHEFTPENTAITSRGTRRCRACHREGERARRGRLAA
jgi:hypothetical protein